MNLNYWEPFKNNIVFWVSEIAFIMTSVKYMVAMLQLSVPVEDTNAEERSRAMGIFLIAADAMAFVLFFISGILCIVLLCRSWKLAEKDETKEKTSNDGMRRRRSRKMTTTMVVPVVPVVSEAIVKEERIDSTAADTSAAQMRRASRRLSQVRSSSKPHA